METTWFLRAANGKPAGYLVVGGIGALAFMLLLIGDIAYPNGSKEGDVSAAPQLAAVPQLAAPLPREIQHSVAAPAAEKHASVKLVANPKSPKPAAKHPSAGSSSKKRETNDKSGASPESEAAVELGLHWLAVHQILENSSEGGWNFDHRGGQCHGQCSDPGTMTVAVNAATGLALLPLIGHGNTHLSGPHKENVSAGLAYLIRRMGADGRLWEPGGTMYSHALATFALCEDQRVIAEGFNPPPEPGASTSTALPASPNAPPPAPAGDERREKIFRNAAERAVGFTLRAQDPVHGGWRYEIAPASDISVTGWQTLALDSAIRAHISVPARSEAGIQHLLGILQHSNGFEYGYSDAHPKSYPCRIAIGLLLRTKTGWEPTRKAIQDGAEALTKHGISKDDMYFNYYATYALHQVGGNTWKKWSDKMRDYLLQTQSHTGHETGSWSFRGGKLSGNEEGGRLLDTALACLILEAYYRGVPPHHEDDTTTAISNGKK